MKRPRSGICVWIHFFLLTMDLFYRSASTIFSPRSPRSSPSLYPTVNWLERLLKSFPLLDSPSPTPLSPLRCAAMSWPVLWRRPLDLTITANTSAWEVWPVSPTEVTCPLEPCALTFPTVDIVSWSTDPMLVSIPREQSVRLSDAPEMWVEPVADLPRRLVDMYCRFVVVPTLKMEVLLPFWMPSKPMSGHC